MLVAGSGLLAVAAFADPTAVRDGGTFRVIAPDSGSIDPAISFGPPDVFLQATCALLLRQPDRHVPGGERLVPEVAKGFPRVSRDGKTYTFMLRNDFRFSNGARLTAAAFAHGIDRIFSPELHDEFVDLSEIVGAADVLAGRATHVAGVRTSGNMLSIRLTAAAPDFVARLSSHLCSVPPTLPVDPEGIRAPLPGAGPYYVAQYVPGKRIVLARNRFYRGRRPHHVDQIVGALTERAFSDFAPALAKVAKGQADWALVGDYGGLSRHQRASKQFFSAPGFTMRYLVMNTSRGVFKDNPRLRRAVNFAIDRSALLRQLGGTLVGRFADHYMPTSMPGFRHVRIYPLNHPDLRRARALARGHTKSGKAVLYVIDGTPLIAVGQVVQRNLRKIGIDVEIRRFPGGAYYDALSRAAEPYDLAVVGWAPDFYDPAAFLNEELAGDQVGSGNFARFDSPRYNRLLARAGRLSGPARYRAYGKLDVQLARNATPLAAFMNHYQLTYVSKRTGCVVVNPFLDLAAVCLKR